MTKIKTGTRRNATERRIFVILLLLTSRVIAALTSLEPVEEEKCCHSCAVLVPALEQCPSVHIVIAVRHVAGEERHQGNVHVLPHHGSGTSRFPAFSPT